jgi:sigma-B regulation protein RsbU (phosphoserine phosphatase)
MEPNYFPEMGRYFSAYSLRHHMSADEEAGIPDSITTVREGPFEYFDAVWYKTPRTLGKAWWIEAFDDYNEGTLSSPDILTSYCCPMRDASGQFIGSMTACLTLKWLSEIISPLKPYPNSSAIMMGRTGTYLVHPDTAKIYRESIFSDPDPRVRSEIEAMGRDMLAGHSGVLQTIVDDNPAFILYRPLERTGWSIAIVCPESDIYARYNSLLTTVWIIIGIGLLLLMLFCYLIVRRAIQPLSQLDLAARRIAGGQFDVPLSESPRRDSIGRLNNSFVSMQQSLAESVANIQHVNAELEQQNEELTRAYQLKLETNRQKTIFIQDMYHQIRTPLNIISGFTQVLSENLRMLPADEVADITTRIKESAADISRLTKELSD